MTACAALLSACSHNPPPDFAPDPALVARIRGVQIVLPERYVCPGGTITAYYDAITDSGRIRFARRYDEDHPPPLHVSFLERSGLNVRPQSDGDFTTSRDPAASVLAGFRLRAVLGANPAVEATAVVPPDYSCLPRGVGFEGRSGGAGGAGMAGEAGPDVTVRLAVLRSPFYERLVVASIEVGEAPAFYLFADANTVPPRDWLIVETAGGRGGRGVAGSEGNAGAPGVDGCPGSPGGSGGAGGTGGPGGRGGRGGRITIVAPAEEPFLAGLVDARSPGGPAGRGGPGGRGGAGGRGGHGRTDAGGRRCDEGSDGAKGQDGSAGPNGLDGSPGSRPQVLTVGRGEVFGAHAAREIRELMRWAEQR